MKLRIIALICILLTSMSFVSALSCTGEKDRQLIFDGSGSSNSGTLRCDEGIISFDRGLTWVEYDSDTHGSFPGIVDGLDFSDSNTNNIMEGLYDSGYVGEVEHINDNIGPLYDLLGTYANDGEGSKSWENDNTGDAYGVLVENGETVTTFTRVSQEGSVKTVETETEINDGATVTTTNELRREVTSDSGVIPSTSTTVEERSVDSNELKFVETDGVRVNYQNGVAQSAIDTRTGSFYPINENGDVVDDDGSVITSSDDGSAERISNVLASIQTEEQQVTTPTPVEPEPNSGETQGNAPSEDEDENVVDNNQRDSNDEENNNENALIVSEEDLGLACLNGDLEACSAGISAQTSSDSDTKTPEVKEERDLLREAADDAEVGEVIEFEGLLFIKDSDDVLSYVEEDENLPGVYTVTGQYDFTEETESSVPATTNTAAATTLGVNKIEGYLKVFEDESRRVDPEVAGSDVNYQIALAIRQGGDLGTLNSIGDNDVLIFIAQNSEVNKDAAVERLRDEAQNIDDVEELTGLLAIDDSLLRERVYDKIISDEEGFEDICKSRSFRNSCLNYLSNSKPEDIDKYAHLFSKEEIIGCVSSGACYGEGADNMIKAFNDDNKCSGWDYVTFCLFTEKIDRKQIITEGTQDVVERHKYDGFGIEETFLSFKFDGDRQDINCNSGRNCRIEIEHLCKSTSNEQSCVRSGLQALSSIIDYDEADSAGANAILVSEVENRLNDYFCNDGSSCKELNCDDSGDNCNVDEFCAGEDETFCKSVVNDAINDLKSDEFYVETNVFFDVLSRLANNDVNAKKAARFFGFEDDFNDVPLVLREDAASAICLYKIDGYLDKTREGEAGVLGGGITSFEYDLNQPFREGIVSTDLIVRYDLRAQRTDILPDNTTQVVYSYFIRAPSDADITYALRIGYEKGEEKVKIPVTDFMELAAGEVDSGFDNFNLEINNSIPGELGIFTINLRALSSSGDRVIDASAPIVLATPDAYEAISLGGTALSSAQAQVASDSEIDNFWND